MISRRLGGRRKNLMLQQQHHHNQQQQQGYTSLFYYYKNTLIFQNQKFKNPIIFQKPKFPKITTVTTTDFFQPFSPKKCYDIMNSWSPRPWFPAGRGGRQKINDLLMIC